MGKTVFGLLSEIYNGNFDKLPEKIKINGKIFIKSSIYNDYKKVDSDGSPSEWLVEYLSNEYDNIVDWLKLPVEEVEEGKWKPKKGEEYWYAYDCGTFITKAIWDNSKLDNYRYFLNICFKTVEEAEQYKEKIQTEIELRKLAEKLNNGEKIDWEDTEKEKYYLYYDSEDEEVYTDYIYMGKFPKQIYVDEAKDGLKSIKKQVEDLKEEIEEQETYL